MTVNGLIEEVLKGGTLCVPFEYMLDEYNHAVRELCLMLPAPDASVTLEAVDGVIECELLPRQIRRIFCRGYELISASRPLLSLLPHAKLYHAADDGIYVSESGECEVFYRSLPKAVSAPLAMSAEVYGGECERLLLRERLECAAYQYIGDYESADALAKSYNARLDDYKKANGVSE